MTLTKPLLESKINLVLERLKNLQRPVENMELAGTKAGEAIGVYTRDFGMEPWDWPQGVGLYGMHSVYSQNKDPKIKEYLLKWFEKHQKIGLPVENVNTSAPFIALSYILDEFKMPQEYADNCSRWADWLINELPRTKDSGFQHVTTKNADKREVSLNTGELWVDTLFMTIIFLAKMGVRNDNTYYKSAALQQYLIHIKYLFEKKDNLFYHGFTFLENHNFGGVYWCRGNSWFTSALMDFLEIMGTQIDDGVKNFLLDTHRAQVEKLLSLQSKNGLWHTVLLEPKSYEEVSGSAGIAYGILKGVRMGFLPESYKAPALKAITGIIENISADGTVLNVSAGTGMGHNKEHYMNIMKAPMAYGQSLVVIALAEAMRHM